MEPVDTTPIAPEKQQYVYLLVSTSGATYVGATVDLDHRLRQHNKELKGGAKATSMKVERGETWQRHCYVSGFPTWQSALHNQPTTGATFSGGMISSMCWGMMTALMPVRA